MLLLACCFAVVLALQPAAAVSDWLIDPPTTPVTVSETTVAGGKALVMSNGLIERTWLIEPNWVTWSCVARVHMPVRLAGLLPSASWRLL